MFGNYIDLTILLYVLVYAISGTRKSIADSLANLLSLAAGVFLAFATYDITAGFLEEAFHIRREYADTIGFFLNTSIFKLAIILILDRLFRKYEEIFKGGNIAGKRLAGAIISGFYGFILAFTVSAAFISLSLPTFIEERIEDSRFGNIVQQDIFGINHNFEAIFGNVLKVALDDFDFLSIRTGPQEMTDLGFKALEVTIDEEAEEKMLEMVNDERTSRGLKPLNMNEEARQAARDYGKYLFQHGIFSHTDLEGGGPGDRMKNYDVEYMMLGENLAYAPNLERAHDGLMNSEGHRKNILHPFFGRVGIGVIDGGEEYGMIFVQEFLD